VNPSDGKRNNLTKSCQIWAAGATVAATALAGGCGTFPASPQQVAQNYVSQIADGNFSGACALLDAQARTALVHNLGPGRGCGAVLARCLPSSASVLKRNQTQLLFTDVQGTVTAGAAVLTVSGTAVAREIGQLTLRKLRAGGWQLTSYGRALKSCSTRRGR
jgi:hypothetical protein